MAFRNPSPQRDRHRSTRPAPMAVGRTIVRSWAQSPRSQGLRPQSPCVRISVPPIVEDGFRRQDRKVGSLSNCKVGHGSPSGWNFPLIFFFLFFSFSFSVVLAPDGWRENLVVHGGSWTRPPRTGNLPKTERRGVSLAVDLTGNRSHSDSEYN